MCETDCKSEPKLDFRPLKANIASPGKHIFAP